MADDIFNVQPPAWLRDLTRSDPGMAGKIVGELVGGTAIAAQRAQGDVESGKADTWAGAWLSRIPQGVQEARLNVSDPMWRLKAQQAELGMAHTALQMQEQVQQIDLGKTKAAMLAKDNETGPQWMRDHPTLESRIGADAPVLLTPEWNRNFDQLQLRDSQSVQAKVMVSGVKSFTDRIAVLGKTDPTAAAQIAGAAGQYTQRGQMPSPAIMQSLQVAEQAAQTNLENTQAQRQMEIDAEVKRTEESGGTVKRTYGPKGESVTVSPSPTGGKTVKPESMVLAGHTVIYNPKGGGFKVVTPGGDSKDMSPTQLRSIAELMSLSDDKKVQQDGEQITQFLGQTALKQIGKGGTNAPVATPAATPTAAPAAPANPYKTNGVYRAGDKKLKYLGGDWNDQKNWQEVP